jgi:hypothetical protein
MIMVVPAQIAIDEQSRVLIGPNISRLAKHSRGLKGAAQTDEPFQNSHFRSRSAQDRFGSNDYGLINR